MANEEVKTKEYYKKVAVEQRTVLGDLFRHKNRPIISRPSVERVFILAKEEVERWRAFIR